jgi:hypothetical protein
MFDRRGLRWSGQLIKMDSNRNLGKYGKQETRGAGKRKAKDRMARAFGEEVDEEKKGKTLLTKDKKTFRRNQTPGRAQWNRGIRRIFVLREVKL